MSDGERGAARRQDGAEARAPALPYDPQDWERRLAAARRQRAATLKARRSAVVEPAASGPEPDAPSGAGELLTLAPSARTAKAPADATPATAGPSAPAALTDTPASQRTARTVMVLFVFALGIAVGVGLHAAADAWPWTAPATEQG